MREEITQKNRPALPVGEWGKLAVWIALGVFCLVYSTGGKGPAGAFLCNIN